MKRRILLLALAVAMALSIREATAIPSFMKAFEAKYITPAANPELTKAFNTKKCTVCHAPAAPKTEMNPYGTKLMNLIPGNASQRRKDAEATGGAQAKAAEDVKLLGELNAAFPLAEKLKPFRAQAETYGDRLKAGKLPIP